jgi:hypothetical protein
MTFVESCIEKYGEGDFNPSDLTDIDYILQDQMSQEVITIDNKDVDNQPLMGKISRSRSRN